MHLSSYLCAFSLASLVEGSSPFGVVDYHKRFNKMRVSPNTYHAWEELSHDAPHLITPPRQRKWPKYYTQPAPIFGYQPAVFNVPQRRVVVTSSQQQQSKTCPWKGHQGEGCPFKNLCPISAYAGLQVTPDGQILIAKKPRHSSSRTPVNVIYRHVPVSQEKPTETAESGLFSDEDPVKVAAENSENQPTILPEPKPSHAGRTVYDHRGNLVHVVEAPYSYYPAPVYAPSKHYQKLPRVLPTSVYKVAGKTNKLSHKFLKPSWKVKHPIHVDPAEVQSGQEPWFGRSSGHGPAVVTSYVSEDEILSTPTPKYTYVVKEKPHKWGRTFVY